jgi:glycosyltransferase involved in cell wall biosynthesis
MRLALIHDYLAQAGGAERVLSLMNRVYPDSPIYTSIYDPESTLSDFRGLDIRTSFLQKWPIANKRFHKLALPFFASAFESFDLSEFDVVLSSASSFAKGVLTGPNTCHICYCHTPARFAWQNKAYLEQSRSTSRIAPILQPMMSRLRRWDLDAAGRVDYFIANSYNIARRIRKYYRRDVAAVIHPPVNLGRFQIAPPREVGDYFLVLSRLIGYKRIDIAIKACNELQVPLHIIGDGPDAADLKAIAGPTIRFLGWMPDTEVVHEIARCRALIFAGEEDFGITPLEAMAAGRPVVAYGAGGALESVLDRKTGVFFEQQTSHSLAAALVEIMSMDFDPEFNRRHASRFDESVFENTLRRFVENAREDYLSHNAIDGISSQFVSHDIGWSNGEPQFGDSLIKPANESGARFKVNAELKVPIPEYTHSDDR